jgi:thiamine biosynthesis lipoprotein
VKPGGSPWTIGIESPSFDGLEETIELRDAAVATSGSYRQYFESGGEVVHHIIDPRTGHNSQSAVVSVSIRAADCALADALATGLMVTGPAELAGIRAALGEPFAALFLLRTSNGEIERVADGW